jgi:predicted nucleic acid-binding protein
VNVVDSSAWLEYFADTPRAATFAGVIENVRQLIVPVITLYEVFKKVLRERDETQALRAVAQMSQGRVIDVDTRLCLEAARWQLPLADSLIYATARRHAATLWTQDGHFEGLDGVRYFARV